MFPKVLVLVLNSSFFPSPVLPPCVQGTFQADGQEVLWEEVMSLGAAPQSPSYQLQHMETLLKDASLEPLPYKREVKRKRRNRSGKVG